MRRKFLITFFLCQLLSFPSVSKAQLPLSTDYAQFIQQRIYSSLVYPTDAFTQGREGVVTLKFTIGQDGYLKDIFIEESSGHDSLDENALEAVKNASPYPLPEDYSGEDVELVVPLRYRLETTAQPAQIIPPEQWLLQEEGAIDLTPEQEVEANDEQDMIQSPEPEPEKQNLEAGEKAFRLPTPPAEVTQPFKVAWEGELKEFIDLAIQNSKPSQTAKKEVDLAEFKVREAMRNLLPAVKLSGYATQGKTSELPYEEHEQKIEINQPIYYGGRLIDSIEHAKVNAEISRRNLDRMKYDVIHKTESAYYNLVASRTHWKHKEALRNEAQELLDRIVKLADIGMIIPLELKSVQSSFEQIEFQLASLKQDIYLAELTLKQVLNSQDAPTIHLEEPAITKPNLNLDELFDVALKYRAEIHIGELMVKFSKYAKKIELDKDNFNVDLTGNAGLYSGHYKTEPWKTSTNWAAGIKVTKMLGASTLRSSAIAERSKPRFGQSAPVESDSISAELGILDNLAAISALKKTDVDLQKAISDLNETRKTVTFEVQDAFLTYQKAILQLNTASADMTFRRNQAEITKIRASVNDAPLSSAMDSLFSYAEAQTKYFQALGNYFLAIANLKKATGYGIDIY